MNQQFITPLKKANAETRAIQDCRRRENRGKICVNLQNLRFFQGTQQLIVKKQNKKNKPEHFW